MRTLIAVVLTILVLAFLAGWAVRGVRRVSDAPAGRPRSVLQLVAEGLIVLGVLVLGVFIVIAIAGRSD